MENVSLDSPTKEKKKKIFGKFNRGGVEERTRKEEKDAPTKGKGGGLYKKTKKEDKKKEVSKKRNIREVKLRKEKKEERKEEKKGKKKVVASKKDEEKSKKGKKLRKSVSCPNIVAPNEKKALREREFEKQLQTPKAEKEPKKRPTKRAGPSKADSQEDMFEWDFGDKDKSTPVKDKGNICLLLLVAICLLLLRPLPPSPQLFDSVVNHLQWTYSSCGILDSERECLCIG